MAAHSIAIMSLLTGGACALIIIIDLLSGNKQHMMVMNFVWPITSLYAGPLALFAYFTIGRQTTHKKLMEEKQKMASMQKPMWQNTLTSTLHCGSGCTIGDILAEIFLLAVPVTVAGSMLYGSWLIDYLFAYICGIVFQYYSIKPMKHTSPKQTLIAALKADTLSLTSWQIGMYGGMAIATFLIFGHRLNPSTALFWFVMQGAMLLGFITSFPINWWLLKKGIKEAM